MRRFESTIPSFGLFCLVVAAVFMSACAGGRAQLSRVERPAYAQHLSPAPKTQTLLVLLHGWGDDAGVFEREGFIEELRRAEAQVDVVSVDVPRESYRRRVLTRQLHEQIVKPARAQGYERVYMVGVSLGGLGALNYARVHAEDIDGVLVFAPFMGPGFLVGDLDRQGGLARWSPENWDGWRARSFDKWPPGRDITAVWTWLRTSGAKDVDIHVAYGDGDDFVPAMDLLAEAIPEANRRSIDGGHDWVTWRRLWADFLRRDPYRLAMR